MFIVFSTCGNILVIHTIFRMSTHRLGSHSNRLLLNLFIADVLVGITAMPIYMINLIVDKNLYNESMCHFTAFLKTFVMLFSIYSLALVCIERLYMFKFPIRHRKMFLSVRPYILSIVVFSLSIPSLAISSFEVVYFSKQHLCWFRLHQLSFVAVFLILTFCVPTLTLVLSTVIIFKILHAGQHVPNKLADCNQSGNTPTPTARRKKSLRATYTLLLMLLAFLGCYVPSMVTFLCELSNYCQISERLTVGSKFLHFSKSILNTLIYGVLNKEVSRRLLKVTKKFYNWLCIRYD